MINKVKTAILLSAGLGTRMRPITHSIPKPLVKVNDKSLIETVIDSLVYYGIENIYIVTGYLADKFSFLEKKYFLYITKIMKQKIIYLHFMLSKI